jgi:hypothetical protein
MRPVLAGMWQQYQLRDGTYDFADLCEAHQLLDWKDETLRKASERGE